MPNDNYMGATIISTTALNQATAEVEFASLMQTVRRQSGFDPTRPLTITVEQKATGCNRRPDGLFPVSLEVLELLGEKIVSIHAHDQGDEESSDVFWLSGHPETDSTYGRAIFITRTSSTEDSWTIDEFDVTKVAGNVTNWTFTVPESEVISTLKLQYVR